ncbi:MAG: MFS transporter [Proteiniphilum sp.]|jgi:DHA3 family multidrug efflux protein-like MFS transporter|nr:MFS transporter [Proteiniphilum sp.]MDD2938064.1 MFS transporter [Proteiniphilum sp.]MDD3778840.1 MFS transporter [Proteiniphilum sp.]MDD3956455.1 MFS transporter [Proteiniphilum sp.]MDD4452839.1 MFS transporter [Proteiniphilum sp.]
MKRFLRVLVNIAVANTSAYLLWSAFSFWIYLETKSVLVLSVLSGTYMLLVTISSMFFGTIVDKHKKKKVMMGASVATMVFLLLASAIFLLSDRAQIANIHAPAFWLFSLPLLLSALTGNLRAIALSTTVSILVPQQDYARANGLIGTIQGFGMIANTVFSGLIIGYLGMDWAIFITLLLSTGTLIHLFFLSIPEEHIVHDPHLQNSQVDFRGAFRAIHLVPGLMALIFFTTFNNFIGGVFAVLLDPYGLALFQVEVWGIILGLAGTGFIFGGLLIGKLGLGKKPLRSLLLGYIFISLICMLFTLREGSLLFVGGMFLYMLIAPIVEAGEQTIIQTVVPKPKQGRVFGFAQTVEAGVTPISIFIIGPLAQSFIIPYVESDAGKQAFGWLLGEGAARGIALTFVVAGAFMLLLSILAFRTKAYHILSASYKRNIDRGE